MADGKVADDGEDGGREKGEPNRQAASFLPALESIAAILQDLLTICSTMRRRL
jgi:hypothetical protein